jgi:trans-2,3-dihydro-3-hydroxyanthranilate isomerase
MRYYVLDVFTDTRLKGNPLAVVLDADELSTATMQAIAREFNLSETTFVLKPTAAAADRRIRIFTPALELPLAGHPVIGTWFLLASNNFVTTVNGWNTFHQELQAEVLPVEILKEDNRVSEVWMTQATPRFFEQLEVDEVLSSLGLERDDREPSIPAQFVSTGVKQLMLPLRNIDALRRIQPSGNGLSAVLAAHDSHLVYAFVEDQGSVHARAVFSAGTLLFEDAATGSAAGALTAYLGKYRQRSGLQIQQGDEMGRASTIHSRISGDGAVVKVGGTAVIFAEGQLAEFSQ